MSAVRVATTLEMHVRRDSYIGQSFRPQMDATWNILPDCYSVQHWSATVINHSTTNNCHIEIGQRKIWGPNLRITAQKLESTAYCKVQGFLNFARSSLGLPALHLSSTEQGVCLHYCPALRQKRWVLYPNSYIFYSLSDPPRSSGYNIPYAIIQPVNSSHLSHFYVPSDYDYGRWPRASHPHLARLLHVSSQKILLSSVDIMPTFPG
jgi:hypothetical protein